MSDGSTKFTTATKYIHGRPVTVMQNTYQHGQVQYTHTVIPAHNPSQTQNPTSSTALESKKQEPKIDPYIKLMEDEEVKVKNLWFQKLYQLEDIKDGEKTQIGTGSYGHMELVIGLDFGTSSVKAVVSAPMYNNFSYAVPFVKGAGIDSYLLPTLMYRNLDGTYTLENMEGLPITDLKLKLIEEPGSKKAQAMAAIYLSLVLKRIRGWLFTYHNDKTNNVNLYWRLTIGVPSSSASDKKMAIWKKIAQAAWNLSLKTEQPLFEDALFEFLTLNLDEDFVQAKTETEALIYSFIENQGQQNNQTYVLVDVGAATVDICGFWYTKGWNRPSYEITIEDAVVKNLGTKVCHDKRVNLWKKAALNERSKLNQYQRNVLVDSLENISELRPDMLLPDSYREYVTGCSLEGIPHNQSPDDRILGKISDITRQTVSFMHSQRNAAPCVDIYLSGGGSKCKVYAEAIARTYKNARKICQVKNHINSFQSSLGIDRDTVNDEEIWIRLSTAYGLSKDG